MDFLPSLSDCGHEYLDYIVETHTAQPVVISPISDKVSGANIGLARELNRRK